MGRRCFIGLRVVCLPLVFTLMGFGLKIFIWGLRSLGGGEYWDDWLIGVVGGLKDVKMTDVVVYQLTQKYPLFEYGGRKWGGKKKCVCAGIGLDINGVWGCRCAFDC